MSECYKTANNKYSDCPPRMSDGRHFTDYRPNNQLDLLIASDNKTQGSFQYRQFLQQNGNALMKANREVAVRNNGCSNCSTSPRGVEGFDNGTMLPEQYIQTCNGNSCEMRLNDPNGVGVGRNFYTTMAQVNLAQGVPFTANDCMGQQAHYASYGDASMTQMRNASPLGGRLNEHASK